MRLIKLGIISAVFLFLLVTAISLLLPSTINISKAIDINAPIDTVYVQLNDLAKWKNWFANYDSSATTFSAKPVGVGGWIRMNKTTVTITANSANQIKTSWHSGNKSLEGEFNLLKQDGASQTTLQWHFIQHVKWYPWEKFASIVTDKVMSPAMEKSLDNLKKITEK